MHSPPAGIYIALLSIHGLIRGKNLELGRDADTGGQTLYVVELAQALARQPGVARVDLITPQKVRGLRDEFFGYDSDLPSGPRRFIDPVIALKTAIRYRHGLSGLSHGSAPRRAQADPLECAAGQVPGKAIQRVWSFLHRATIPSDSK